MTGRLARPALLIRVMGSHAVEPDWMLDKHEDNKPSTGQIDAKGVVFKADPVAPLPGLTVPGIQDEGFFTE